MLAEASPSSSTADPGGVRIGNTSELSLNQEQIWLDEQITPGTAAYNMPLALHFKGALDVGRLERCLTEIVRRHDVLRSTFPMMGDRPVQVVRSDAVVALSMVAVTDGSMADRLDRVRLTGEDEARRPFDLARGPLFRFRLLVLSTNQHTLIVNVHHIVFDGWSIGLFLKELVTLYAAFSEGRPSPLPDLPIRYFDFAHGQRRNLQGEDLDKLVSFWRAKLEGIPRHLALPFDHPVQSGRHYRGSRHPLVLGQELTTSLKDLSRGEGATTYMALLAALATLLHRYTGQTDIVIGTPTAGRMSVKTRAVVGAFINTLVLRNDLAGEFSFRELIGRARRTALEAFSYQELPFNSLVSALNPERDSSGSSLLQVMLVLQTIPFPDLEMPGLTVELQEIETGTAKYDLTLELRERAGRLVGWFEYDNELFEPGTIARMAGHFQTLLEAAVADPDRSVAELPLLSEPERRQVIETWNATRVDYPQDTCLHDLIEAQVERTPGAVALVFEDQVLSYRELNKRANRLANRLRAVEVGPESLVGVCVDRSVEMVVALLGVVKAGGAYVPLDPEYPAERLAFMVADSDMPLLLTQRRHAGRLSASGRRMIYLDEADDELPAAFGENSGARARPDNLVYVIYTSGSTGRPKGVQIKHAALANFLHSMRQMLGMTAGDSLMAVTTLSFDIAAFELFLPLTVGARLVVVDREVATDGSRLIERLARDNITFFQATPATWRLLLEAGWEGSASLTMLCGGETLPRDLADRLLPRGACLWNLYGPTETTIWSAAARVEAGTGPVPIGRPIANTQIYVLDAHMQPVPIGVSGELCIGGVGLARSYLGRGGLTSERFLPNPFHDRPHARLYRTGDQARWRNDGMIELLGRLDGQVKIRGHRIEIGEIEAVLRSHPAVREAAVSAWEEGSGQKRLAAYIVNAEGGSAHRVGDLRGFLKERLPEYMIPAAFVFLADLPRMPNGKMDRKALPAPNPVGHEPGESFAAPRTPIERELARIWSQVLHVNALGIQDNFFDIGGHSLLAAQVISRINDTFAVKLPLRRIFETPTVAGLAEALAGDAATRVRESLRLLKPGGTGPALFLVHDGLGDTHVYNNLAAHMPEIVKVFGLDPYGTGYCPILHTRIPDMAAYYVQQIRQIQPEGPFLLGSLCAGGMIAFEMALQLEARGHSVGLVALMDAPGPQLSVKPWLTNQRRWANFTSGIRATEGVSRLGRLYDGSARAGRKLRNLLVYESTHKVKRLSDMVRFRLLREVLDHGRPVPRLLQGMSVETVLSFARKEYAPSRLLQGKAALIRASEGQGTDEPVMNMTGDPLLDWGGRVKGELEVLDMPGGHSSMLQEPHVQELAKYLSALIGQALARRVAV